jgi:hypothetical protein
MKLKTTLHCKPFEGNESGYFRSHHTSFLDKEFFEKFQDEEQPMKPVVIRSLDTSWIFKQDEGMQFLIALSESENMSYFGIDTIKLLVNYQWRRIKPLIIYFLFIPFLLNMILFNFYGIFLFKWTREADHDPRLEYL